MIRPCRHHDMSSSILRIGRPIRGSCWRGNTPAVHEDTTSRPSIEPDSRRSASCGRLSSRFRPDAKAATRRDRNVEFFANALRWCDFSFCTRVRFLPETCRSWRYRSRSFEDHLPRQPARPAVSCEIDGRRFIDVTRQRTADRSIVADLFEIGLAVPPSGNAEASWSVRHIRVASCSDDISTRKADDAALTVFIVPSGCPRRDEPWHIVRVGGERRCQAGAGDDDQVEAAPALWTRSRKRWRCPTDFRRAGKPAPVDGSRQRLERLEATVITADSASS